MRYCNKREDYCISFILTLAIVTKEHFWTTLRRRFVSSFKHTLHFINFSSIYMLLSPINETFKILLFLYRTWKFIIGSLKGRWGITCSMFILLLCSKKTFLINTSVFKKHSISGKSDILIIICFHMSHCPTCISIPQYS